MKKLYPYLDDTVGDEGTNWVMITSLVGLVLMLAVGIYLAIKPAPPVHSDFLVQTSAAEIQSTIGINYLLSTVEGEPNYVGTIRFELGADASRTASPHPNRIQGVNEEVLGVATATATFAPVPGVVYCTPGAVGVDPCLDAWVALGTPHELVNVPARWTVTLPPTTTPFSTATRSWFVTLPPVTERGTPEPERSPFLQRVPEAAVPQRGGGYNERSE